MSGQTSVVARVEAPETTPAEDEDTDAEAVDTGDESRIELYILLAMLGIGAITFHQISGGYQSRVYQPKKKEK